MEAIILAGGYGKRLYPLTAKLPKCMVPINGKPLLDYQLDWLGKYGLQRIIIACGYRWKEIKKHYGSKLIYSAEEEPLGTGGAVKRAVELLDGHDFLLLNCDDLTDINLAKLFKMGSNCIALARFNSPFGLVATRNSKVVKFEQKPLLPYWAWCGLALLNKGLPFPEKGSLEIQVFPRIKLKAYRHKGFWITVNTRKDMEEAEARIKNKGVEWFR